MLKMHEDNPPAPGQETGADILPMSLQLSVFGDAVHVIPSTGVVYEMPAESHFCEQCCETVRPVPLSTPSYGWIPFPCHQTECGACFGYEDICPNCENCPSCCHCEQCGYCGEATDDELCSCCTYCSSCCQCSDCAYCGTKWPYGEMEFGDDCDHCVSCECSCETDAQECWSERVAGWNVRKWSVRTDYTENVETTWYEDFGQRIDPVLGMADFYLSEYVSAALTTRIRTTKTQPCHNGLRAARQLAQDAATLQSHLVNKLDEAFREYAFLAIGGEVRHHPASEMPSAGRSNTWAWWRAMGDKYGRAQLIEDAIVLFDDYGWSAGYGGEKWAEAARILLARENGTLDARTFVDRCFTLQHNGGSFLDKLRWAQDGTLARTEDAYGYRDWPAEDGGYTYARYYSLRDMLDIGNAHASDIPNLPVLLKYATPDARSLCHTLFRSFRPLATTPSERDNYDYWTDCHNDHV